MSELLAYDCIAISNFYSIMGQYHNSKIFFTIVSDFLVPFGQNYCPLESIKFEQFLKMVNQYFKFDNDDLDLHTITWNSDAKTSKFPTKSSYVETTNWLMKQIVTANDEQFFVSQHPHLQTKELLHYLLSNTPKHAIVYKLIGNSLSIGKQLPKRSKRIRVPIPTPTPRSKKAKIEVITEKVFIFVLIIILSFVNVLIIVRIYFRI
jgi:hypothetical protein